MMIFKIGIVNLIVIDSNRINLSIKRTEAAYTTIKTRSE